MKRRMCAVALVAFGTLTAPALADDQVVAATDALVWDKPDVSVEPGQKVTWTFAGTAQVHHVAATGSTPGDARWQSFVSPLAVAAPDVAFVFDAEGTYTYYCSVHKDTMVGTVRVSKTPLPPPVVAPLPLSAQPLGNDTAADGPVETTVAVDKRKPTLSRLSARRAATRGRATVRFRVSEDAVTGVVFSRGKKVVKAYRVIGAGTRSLTARGLRAGRYTVTLVAVDVAGNESRVKQARVTVR